MKRFTPRLTYANVMATVAVFVALGGSSYAAIALRSNSVRSKHIATGQVKRSDLSRNAVDSSKVANGKLRADDFAAGQLPRGAAGASGVQGPPGPKGDKGESGTSVVTRAQNTGPVASESTTDAQDGTAVPLSGNTWSQGALENDLVLASVAYTPPATCRSDAGGGIGVVDIWVGGKSVGGVSFGEAPFFSNPTTSPVTANPAAVVETGASTSRTVTALARDFCNTGQHYTIDSVRIVVIALG